MALIETRLRIVDGRQKEKFRNAAQVALWLTDKGVAAQIYHVHVWLEAN